MNTFIPAPMKRKANPTCGLCGSRCEDEHGNNPYPLPIKGRVCNDCNGIVVMARIAVLRKVSR